MDAGVWHAYGYTDYHPDLDQQREPYEICHADDDSIIYGVIYIYQDCNINLYIYRYTYFHKHDTAAYCHIYVYKDRHADFYKYGSAANRYIHLYEDGYINIYPGFDKHPDAVRNRYVDAGFWIAD